MGFVVPPYELHGQGRRYAVQDGEAGQGGAGAAAPARAGDLHAFGLAFQCLVTDEELRASLAAIRAALRPGGRFAFETRHPQARAWQDWNPSQARELTGPAGRALRVWHHVESVTGDLVTFTGTTAEPDGRVLRVDRTTLRFLEVAALDAFLAAAGFVVEGRYGDWDRGPVTATSREIITVARRR
ncbi:hypothetical protein Stsp01_18410 [Streptomyces sp. NBRC 13847]|uniref:hypothetical protein n=1 Tax=Streptomyces kronopolitis TaxID=1612435 RepID=UPI0024A40044|nr:hypothetical protein Stsp01_18410 [Streptomyces sp. NBRC 13847]